MEFTLFYKGPLKSNGGPRHKHEIRQALHPQLEELWRQEPLRNQRSLLWEKFEEWPDEDQVFAGFGQARHQGIWHKASVLESRGSALFAPLVSRKIHLICSLKILLLRPGEPGQVYHAGDLDNRMKTLLDALTVPDANQVAAARISGGDEQPCYCLLEDDSLITRLTVEGDRLLAPDGDPTSTVLAIVRAKIGHTRATPIAISLT
jgi:hypothetical protein